MKENRRKGLIWGEKRKPNIVSKEMKINLKNKMKCLSGTMTTDNIYMNLHQ